MARPLRVCIIGAGIGGLVLAQLLRDDPRFEVSIYDRDPPEGSASLLTGFRILVSPEMLHSLRTNLPKQTAEDLEDAIGLQPLYGHSLFLTDAHANPLMSVQMEEFRDACSVSRWKLRKALLHGLGPSILRFRKIFRSYSISPDQSVAVHFQDGESIVAGVLVGADGAGSEVRRQLIPQAKRIDTGVTVIYWKMPCTRDTEELIPFGGTGCMAVPPRNSFVVSSYKDRRHPYNTVHDPQKIDPDDSFLMCGLGCLTKDFLNKSKGPEEMTPEELKTECVERASNWHPTYKTLVSLAIPSSVYMAHIKTQEPIKPWTGGGRVTLLGDAAHSMTPYLGKGATSAMADALLLARELQYSAEGDHEQLDLCLERYRERMLTEGFKLCDASMRIHRLVYCWGSNRFKTACRDRLIVLLDWFMHLDNQQIWKWIGALFIIVLAILFKQAIY